MNLQFINKKLNALKQQTTEMLNSLCIPKNEINAVLTKLDNDEALQIAYQNKLRDVMETI